MAEVRADHSTRDDRADPNWRGGGRYIHIFQRCRIVIFGYKQGYFRISFQNSTNLVSSAYVISSPLCIVTSYSLFFFDLKTKNKKKKKLIKCKFNTAQQLTYPIQIIQKSIAQTIESPSLHAVDAQMEGGTDRPSGQFGIVQTIGQGARATARGLLIPERRLLVLHTYRRRLGCAAAARGGGGGGGGGEGAHLPVTEGGSDG